MKDFFLNNWNIRLLLLYDLFVGSFFTAAFCFFLDYCLKPNQIFGWWRVYLATRVLHREVPGWKMKVLREFAAPVLHTEGLELPKGILQAMKSKRPIEDKRLYKKKLNEALVDVANDLAYWEKPMGLCMVCMNIYWCWITIWFTGLPNLVWHQHWYYFWVFLVYPTLSNFFLRKMSA